MLRDSGEKLGPAERGSIESAINDLKSAIESNDTASIKRRMDALNQAQHKAAEAMYRNANAAGAQAGPTPGGGEEQASGGGASQGDVIDAEVVEEEKK